MGAPFTAPTFALLLGALVLGATGVREDEGCPSGCSCSRIEQLDMACELLSANVTVKGSPGSKIDIICNSDTKKFSIDELPQMTYGQEQAVRLTLRYCPLPPTFALAASRLGASSVQELYICNGLDNVDITPKILDGLDKLEKLAIYSDKSHNVSIPTQAFAQLPSLQSFTINSANVNLRAGDFNTTPKLTYLELSNCNLNRLPDGIFSSLTELKKLLLWRNELEELTVDQLQGLESLQQIDVSNNKLRSLHGLAAVTRSLRVLAAFANRFEELPSLRNLTSLEEVHIHDNPVQLHIAPQALSSLPLLKTVDLSRASIENLPPDFISNSPSLKTLKLVGNKLKELPPGLFKDQASLEELNLSRNKLEKLNVEGFRPLQALKRLFLDYNNLTAIAPFVFSGLSSLTQLGVSHNSLQSLTTSSLAGTPKLEDLDFSFNNISNPATNDYNQYLLFGGTFTQLTNLRSLDLSHNRLTDMPSDVSRSTPYLKKLNLAYNRIAELVDASFVSDSAEVDFRHNEIETIYVYPADNTSTRVESHQQRSKIFLEDNPFKCDCLMYPFAQRFHNFTPLDAIEAHFVVDDARCASPPSMSGRLFRRVPLRDFTCAHNDDCPDNCSCIYRPYTRALELTCQKLPKIHPNLTTPFGNVDIELKLTERPASLYVETEIRTLNLSGLGLEDMPGRLPHNLKILDLSNNRFDKIPQQLFDKGMIFKLARNPLKCDCWRSNDVATLQENGWRIEDFDQVNCSNNVPISKVNVLQLCSTWRASVIGGVLAMLGLITATIAILLLKYSFEIKVWLYNRGMFARWFVIDDDDRKYDAFVSFCHKDEDFVGEHLLPGLENVSQPYKLCIHYRDWMPGEFITTQIAQSVADSRRTIIVVSKNFLESQWARAEFRTANMTAIKERKTRVIVILLEDVNSHKELDPELKAYLATNTYLKWGDPWFWDKLRYALPHRKADDVKGQKKEKIREKVAKARADEARKVVGAYGLDTRLTADGLIINAAALAVPEDKKRDQITLDMHNLRKIKSMTELKPINV